MKQRQRRTAFSLVLALVMLLTPALALAETTIDLRNGDAIIGATTYTQDSGTTNTAHDGEIMIVSTDGEGTNVPTANTVQINPGDSALSVTIKDVAYDPGAIMDAPPEDSAFLAISNGEIDVKLENVSIGSAAAPITEPAIIIDGGSVGSAGSDVDLDMNNVSIHSSDAAITIHNADAAIDMEGVTIDVGGDTDDGDDKDGAILVDGSSDVDIHVSGTNPATVNSGRAALNINYHSTVTVSGGTLNLSSSGQSSAIDGDNTGKLVVESKVVAENISEYLPSSDNPPVSVINHVTVEGEKTASREQTNNSLVIRRVVITPAVNPPENPTENPTQELLHFTLTLSDGQSSNLYMNADLNTSIDIPLGDLDPDNLMLNGTHFVPDVTPGNCIKLERGDLLMAAILDKDLSFFDELNADNADSPVAIEDIYIRHGQLFLNSESSASNPATGMKLREQTLQSRNKLLGSMFESEPGASAAPVYSDQQALKLLEECMFVLESGQSEGNVSIGNIWQAPVPDKGYDPLSQYVSPKTAQPSPAEDDPDPE